MIRATLCLVALSLTTSAFASDSVRIHEAHARPREGVQDPAPTPAKPVTSAERLEAHRRMVLVERSERLAKEARDTERRSQAEVAEREAAAKSAADARQRDDAKRASLAKLAKEREITLRARDARWDAKMKTTLTSVCQGC